MTFKQFHHLLDWYLFQKNQKSVFTTFITCQLCVKAHVRHHRAAMEISSGFLVRLGPLDFTVVKSRGL
jgi:hypothetical protein